MAFDHAALAAPAVRPAGTRNRAHVRRALVAADVLALTVAFLLDEIVLGGTDHDGAIGVGAELMVFFAMVPAWLGLAKIYGLYDQDGRHAEHSTVDDLVGVFASVTIGVWLFALVAKASGLLEPDLAKVAAFWGGAVVCIVSFRAVARAYCRRRIPYRQNTLIVGAGTIGQLVARKLDQHPEYGLNVVGFVDAEPRERRSDLAQMTVLGTVGELPAIIERHSVDRVVVAFTREPPLEIVASIRSLAAFNLQVDIVPRLFEVVGPNAELHAIEGLPLVGLPPAADSRLTLATKRALDLTGAATALLLLAPVLLSVAAWIRLDSSGPALFRQVRLGRDMRQFTLLKFRTMKLGTSQQEHREYVERLSREGAAPESNGLFKLDREESVTRAGRFLRRTSLDELPQLINVLKGEMSLVGPRPCLPYEVELFEPHHFERFLVPAGITGLWQVSARARSTFHEALDLDVAYVRSFSLGLDSRLLLKTPARILRARETR